MSSIIKKDSGIPGKILSIFCGVHGNEKAGVYAVERAIKELEITKGIVYFVFANPKAIEENVRYIEKNLNRCFAKNELGDSYEEKRARELMELLDNSDALLDIHASNSPNTIPFAITDNGGDIVKNMDFKIIAEGFDEIEPGATDGYMKNLGKIGICIECGYSGESKIHAGLAYTSIVQFLQYFSTIEAFDLPYQHNQKTLYVNEVQKVTSKSFSLARGFADFETLPANFVIASDENTIYKTDKERVILFGGGNGKPVGAEAYILGDWK